MAAEFRILRTQLNSVLSGIVEHAAASYIPTPGDVILSPNSFTV
jgi:hypothetical protein